MESLTENEFITLLKVLSYWNLNVFLSNLGS